ncbi:hypothetical protein [Mesorhizobium sp.]|uniref:hypothetical protein n=1 Tax=Mesorhizobium sp. TaxID=1871066 RepID=UPI000FE7385D|nr:hypothetical protein [Mesorhizobium sp.]RWE31177.1 MAG: hypothetical protein EOS77_17750 [Mesorhizobium sp.]
MIKAAGASSGTWRRALLQTVMALGDVQTVNDYQRVEVEIIRRHRSSSAANRRENAGAEGSIIVGKLRRKPEFSQGWNTQTVEFRALFSMRVLDPAKVVRAALHGLERSPACHYRSDDRREVETSSGSVLHRCRICRLRYEMFGSLPDAHSANALKSPGKRFATPAGAIWHDFWISVERVASNLVTACALPNINR